MAEVSFDSSATEVVAETSAVAVRSEAAVSEASSAPKGRNFRDDEDVSGDFGAEDMTYPAIKIVAGTGKLSRDYRKGSIVLGDEYQIGDDKNPIEVVAVKFRKSFIETKRAGVKLEWNDDTKREFQTAREVVDAGGSFTDYNHPNHFGPMGRMLFFVKKPAHLEAHMDAIFPYTIGEDRYVLASYVATSTAYTGVGKKLAEIKNASGTIRGVTWNFKAVLTPSKSGEYHKATLSPIGQTSPEMLALISEYFG